MIICLIEFEVVPGKEVDQQRWLDILMPEVERVPGFRGKESYTHISGNGRVCTVSFWDNENSLAHWTRDLKHQTAMKQGREEIFSNYEIRICSELRHYSHERGEDKVSTVG